LETTTPQNISTLKAWALASRPRTLPAAVAPVVVASAAAIGNHSFAFLSAAAALLVALLLQIGVNLANDYFDFKKGIDTEDRLGPVRVTQSGLISPERVKAGMMTTFILAALPGIYLMKVGGWPVLIIGIASILAALAYSGGPFPLASHGLGDLFVFIFFGLVAVCGTYYVQALCLTPLLILLGIDVGLLISAILVVNNLRDIETDRKAGKRTFAVIIGERGAKLEYTLLLTGAYILPIAIWLGGVASGWILLASLSFPMAYSLNRRIRQTSGGPVLNQALAQTAKLALVFSVLLAIGLILPLFF
jgi:1,4-dihydroxy-2-naphthoate octaprenyltransferase